MEILQTIVEGSAIHFSKKNFTGTLIGSEKPVISLNPLKAISNYRLEIIFRIHLENSDGKFSIYTEVTALTDFTYSSPLPMRSSHLYVVFAQSRIAVRKKIDEILQEAGINGFVDWQLFHINILEKQLTDAITEMISNNND